MSAKVRCLQCQRKLHGAFTGTECKRNGCPQKEDKSFQTLTFKDWKDPKFEVIEILECTKEDFTWPTSAESEWEQDPVTKEWKPKQKWDMDAFC